MNPVLLPIYGPLAIHAYGLCIAIGGIIALYFFKQDTKLKPFLKGDATSSIFQLIVLSAYFGGRIVCMISESITDFSFLFKFWEPGFSILGSILAMILVLPIYLYINRIPLLLFLDRASLYAPLVQSFGRLGCFFTGCCYGKPATTWYAITYTHANQMAPLHCPLHPTQLYSSIILFGIFLFLYFVQQRRTKTPGMILCSYLILISTERFLLDFVRWDRIFTYNPSLLQLFSVHQWIALTIGLLAMAGAFIISKVNK